MRQNLSCRTFANLLVREALPVTMTIVQRCATTTVCRACGTSFPAQSQGVGQLCFGCLLAPDLPDEDDQGLSVAGPPDATMIAGATDNRRFAHYQVALRADGTLAELGRGGMGVTYQATDTTLHCAVALKVVKPDLVQNAQVRGRFLREAQVAAKLRHPHVASVFFFGERAEDGQLFYAMELVEGETLHARVRRCGGLPVETVLQIGVQVTDALTAAEEQGLTHRDLKPANLMLVRGETVNVKVIDFGLAKAVAEAHADALVLTRTQDFVGTPAFASPEHFNVWQEVDTRSDFYALGATLWYALTGHPPFAGHSSGEIHARQLQGELPMEQLAAAKVPQPLTILLRSLLSPDPAGRPQTAPELAAALARCQHPSAAAPVDQLSLLTRAARWRKLGAVLVLGGLVAGGWAALYHRTSDVARQNSRLQQQTLAQQQQLGTMQAQLQQQTQLIALVNAKIDRNAASVAADPTRSNPAATAQADVARERGISVEALQKQLAGENVDVRQLLVQIDQRLVAAQAQTGQWQRLKCEALTRLGDGEYAAGHYPAAVGPYQQALALIDADKEPLVWCDGASNLELALFQSGRYAEAAPLAQQAVDRRTALQGAEHPATLKALHGQAQLFHAQGKNTESETLYRRILEARERTLGKENLDTLSTLNNLATVLHYRGDDAQAEVLGRRCVEALERTLGKENLATLESVTDLAATLSGRGDYATAATLDRRCLEARQRLLGPDHPSTIASINNLAVDLDILGDSAGAEPLYRRALEVQERTLGPEHPATLVLLDNLGILLGNRGDYTAAESFARRALKGRERVLGPDHVETLRSVSNLAQLLDTKGDFAAAEPLYLRGQAGVERLPPQDEIRMDFEHYFSMFREKQGRLPEALVLAKQVADACKALPESNPLRRTYEQHLVELQGRIAAEGISHRASTQAGGVR